MRLHSAVQAPNAAQQLQESLEGQLGKPVLFQRKFDTKKFEELAKRFSRKGRVLTDTHTE